MHMRSRKHVDLREVAPIRLPLCMDFMSKPSASEEARKVLNGKAVVAIIDSAMSAAPCPPGMFCDIWNRTLLYIRSMDHCFGVILGADLGLYGTCG